MILTLFAILSYIQITYETRFYLNGDVRFSPHGTLFSREVYSKENIHSPPEEFEVFNTKGDTWQVPNPGDWNLVHISDSGELLLLRTVKQGAQIAITLPFTSEIKHSWIFNPIVKAFFGQDNRSVLVFTRESTYVIKPNSRKKIPLPRASSGNVLNNVTVIVSKGVVYWYYDGVLQYKKQLWTPFVRDLKIALGGSGFYVMTPKEIAYFDSLGNIVWRKSHVFSLLSMNANEYAVGLLGNDNTHNIRLVLYDAMTGKSYQNIVIPRHLFGYENSPRLLFLKDTHLSLVFKDRILVYRVTRN